MKIAIGIIALIGLALLVAGRVAEKSINIDTRLSSAIPYFIGIVLLVGDACLTVAYVLYRVFTS